MNVLLLLLRDLEERRPGDVDVPRLDQLAHLPEEERQQQRADVLAVDVGVGEDDDLAVADLATSSVLPMSMPMAAMRLADLVVVEQLFEAGLLDVEHLAAQGQDGLVHAIAAALGASRRPSRLRRGTVRSRRGRGWCSP